MFKDVVDVFGTESPEYARIKARYEQSFKGIPVKSGENVSIQNLNYHGITSEYTEYAQLDSSAIGFEMSKDKGLEKAYELAIDRALEKVTDKSIFKMAKRYTWTDETGKQNIFKSVKDIKAHSDEIKRIAEIRYRFELNHENLYEAIEELEDVNKVNQLKEKLISRGKGYFGALKGKEVENELIELLEIQSKKDFYDSSIEDEEISYSAEDVLNHLTIRGK